MVVRTHAPSALRRHRRCCTLTHASTMRTPPLHAQVPGLLNSLLDLLETLQPAHAAMQRLCAPLQRAYCAADPALDAHGCGGCEGGGGGDGGGSGGGGSGGGSSGDGDGGGGGDGGSGGGGGGSRDQNSQRQRGGSSGDGGKGQAAAVAAVSGGGTAVAKGGEPRSQQQSQVGACVPLVFLS
jgi:hypothetical protein